MHTIHEGVDNYFFLFSGGLDSSYGLLTLLREKAIKNPINLVFFNYGQVAAEYEWAAVLKVYEFLSKEFDREDILRQPHEIDIKSDLFSWTESVAYTGKATTTSNNRFSKTEIENRNMVLFSILSSYILSLINKQKISQCKIVILSGLRDNELPDASSAFFYHLGEAMCEYHKEYEFSVKFIIEESPKQILDNLRDNVFSLDSDKAVEFCESVSSCYSPVEGKPCYECPKCKDVDEIIKFVTNKGRF